MEHCLVLRAIETHTPPTRPRPTLRPPALARWKIQRLTLAPVEATIDLVEARLMMAGPTPMPRSGAACFLLAGRQVMDLTSLSNVCRCSCVCVFAENTKQLILR